MDFFELYHDHAAIFLLLLTRITGIFMISPFFGSMNVPIYFRAGTSLAFAMVLFPVVDKLGIVEPPATVAMYALAVLGEISISGTLIKVDELANSLQVCLDSGAKKVLLPIISAADLGTVPPELVGSFNLIFYSSAEDAVFKALGVE